jgi:hypothetical protein
MQEIGEVSQKPDFTSIRPMAINGNPALPLPNSSADLALVVGWRSTRWLSRDRALLAELQRLLKPEGLIYFEFGGPVDWLLGGQATNGLSEDYGPPQLFWLTPRGGEMHTAVPLGDRETISYFLRHSLYSPSVNVPTRLVKGIGRLLRRSSRSTQRPSTSGGRTMDSAAKQPRQYLRSMAERAGIGLLHAFGRAEGVLGRHRLFSRFTRRCGVLVGSAAAGLAHQPPRYLRLIAQEAGVNVDRHRWGLSAPSAYSSRKVLFFLFGRTPPSPPPNRGGKVGGTPPDTPPDTPPEYIVKMVRDPIFNPRLENEYRALSLLHHKGISDRETVPQVVFFGHHSDLAILGETVINGVPLRQLMKATADCPYSRAAIDWLIDLGAATANPAAATPGQVAAELEKLFTRFLEIYRLTPEQHAFLAGQITAIARSRAAFPLVFQHGDPGPWNMMVTQTGRIAVLDWEAAEPQGIPLWDSFYFLRSYCVGAARAHGIHDRLAGFAQQFLAESPLSRLVVDATRRYCERTGLSGHLVEPLFYTCWMHRALKEATRLAPAKLEEGHFVNLLRLCIEQRNAPTLRRLFSLPGPN